MQECDIQKTSFILRNGQYKKMMVSFGLTNAPTYYMDMMNKVSVGGHKMHIFTTNIPTFHSRYRR
jgi:hypothetical protein